MSHSLFRGTDSASQTVFTRHLPAPPRDAVGILIFLMMQPGLRKVTVTEPRLQVTPSTASTVSIIQLAECLNSHHLVNTDRVPSLYCLMHSATTWSLVDISDGALDSAPSRCSSPWLPSLQKRPHHSPTYSGPGAWSLPERREKVRNNRGERKEGRREGEGRSGKAEGERKEWMRREEEGKKKGGKNRRREGQRKDPSPLGSLGQNPELLTFFSLCKSMSSK